MFDWNDEELANIIWGEAGESDDHIVPYPEASDTGLYEDRIKKEVNEEDAEIKPTAQKKPIAKFGFHGCNVVRNSQYGQNEGLSRGGFGTASWTELSLSNAAKTHQDSMEESALLENGSETQENQHEDREQGDFVDYGWDNIGSFDDLDRIFSNDDPLFGHASLGNVDELWSSSKDVASTPEKSFPLPINFRNSGLGALKSASEQFETKTEYLLDPNQHFTPSYEKMNSQQPAKESFDVTVLEMAGNSTAYDYHFDALGTPNEFAEKENRQKKLIKSRKKSDKKSEGRQLRGLCSSLSPSQLQFQQFDSRFTPTMAPYVYGNLANYYTTAMPAVPHFHSREDSHKPVLPMYEASPGNANPLNTPNDPLKPPTMTPQEKIEKLRRRQKMRAMLAIQNQQQQLSHKVSCTDNAQNYSNENQMQTMEGGKVVVEENLSPLPSLDPNTPMEHDDSNTISVADGCSVDTILYRLQDTIAKLDNGIRLRIRDSLFRLAQSAMQRHSDTSSTNQSSRDELEVFKSEEINNQNRFARIPDVETQTNPVDRSIAHLLFHRPPDSSVKYPETPDSPVSSQLSLGRNMNSLMTLTMGFVPESSKNMQSLSHRGSEFRCLFAEGDQSKNSPCIDSSENPSNNEPSHDRAMDGEASR